MGITVAIIQRTPVAGCDHIVSLYHKLYLVNKQDGVNVLLHKLCNKITNAIKANVNDIDERKVEIIHYGLYLWITDIIKLTLILLTAYYLKIFTLTIVFLISFGVLRTFTGGSHAKTFLGCLISSNLIAFGTVYLSIWLSFINPMIICVVIMPLCTVIVYLFAPADHENKPVTSKKQRKRLKTIAYMILFTEFLLSILFKQSLIMYSVFMVCIGILPTTYKIMNNRHGNGL